MTEMMNWIANEEEGQGMVEYALIIALIAIVVMAALGPVGEAIAAKFEEIGEELGVEAGGNG